jgi:orotidine-5'-phosphate decarboxylase
MTFIDKLRSAQQSNNSLLCIGLDTDVARIPEALRDHERPQFEFNRRIIEATKDLVCAYKINSAFYEAEGEAGWRAFSDTLRSIPRSIISIADVKRGDVGNSSERYASAFLGKLNFDGVTLSPYMGKDSIAPFLQSAEQCAFILAVTSNPGAKDFQHLKVGKKFLYQKVVETALKWNSKKNVGFVVGATQPRELKTVRKEAPSVPLLIPGVGSQGGSIEMAVRYGCDNKGFMAIINASRSILFASSGEDFGDVARKEAVKLREEINAWRGKFFNNTAHL